MAENNKEKPWAIQPSEGVTWPDDLRKMATAINAGRGTSLKPIEWRRFKQTLQRIDYKAYAQWSRHYEHHRRLKAARMLPLSDIQMILSEKLAEIKRGEEKRTSG